MAEHVVPRPFTEWRTGQSDRAEDAAYNFGYFLIRHCRDEALKLTSKGRPEARELAEEAVDLALHNVMDLLEGFWELPVGSDHKVEFVLTVRVRDAKGSQCETQEISPSKLDLPIGYWKWARDRDFR